MAENEQLEEDLDEIEESSEDIDTSDVESENNEEGVDGQKQKKPNAFKKLREELREAKKALREKESKETVKLKPDQEIDARFFFVENPDAKDFKDDIRATIAKFPNMTFDEAFKYIQATRPKESVSKQDFNLRTKGKPSDILQLSDDEAAEKLTPAEYLKYSRAKGSQFLKQGINRK